MIEILLICSRIGSSLNYAKKFGPIYQLINSLAYIHEKEKIMTQLVILYSIYRSFLHHE